VLKLFGQDGPLTWLPTLGLRRLLRAHMAKSNTPTLSATSPTRILLFISTSLRKELNDQLLIITTYSLISIYLLAFGGCVASNKGGFGNWVLFIIGNSSRALENKAKQEGNSKSMQLDSCPGWIPTSFQVQ
jgi:hypothetical protein